MKYCCGYCNKLNTAKCESACYNALGGKEHLDWAIENVCEVKDGICIQTFPFAKHPMSDCWEGE